MNLDFSVSFNKEFTLAEVIEDADDLTQTLLAIRIANPNLQSLLQFLRDTPTI